MTGCEGVVVGGFGEGAWWHRAPAPIFAPRPLGGPPLVGRAKPRDPDLVRAKAERCRPSPILDQVRVDVKRDKVCVRQEVHVLGYESGPVPVPALPAELRSDNGGSRKLSLMVTSGREKVGSCVGLDEMRTAVWVSEYSACIPNDKLIDARTESLSLSKPGSPLSPGYETIRWSFSSQRHAEARRPSARRNGPAAE